MWTEFAVYLNDKDSRDALSLQHALTHGVRRMKGGWEGTYLSAPASQRAARPKGPGSAPGRHIVGTRGRA